MALEMLNLAIEYHELHQICGASFKRRQQPTLAAARPSKPHPRTTKANS